MNHHNRHYNMYLPWSRRSRHIARNWRQKSPIISEHPISLRELLMKIDFRSLPFLFNKRGSQKSLAIVVSPFCTLKFNAKSRIDLMRAQFAPINLNFWMDACLFLSRKRRNLQICHLYIHAIIIKSCIKNSIIIRMVMAAIISTRSYAQLTWVTSASLHSDKWVNNSQLWYMQWTYSMDISDNCLIIGILTYRYIVGSAHITERKRWPASAGCRDVIWPTNEKILIVYIPPSHGTSRAPRLLEKMYLCMDGWKNEWINDAHYKC